MVAEMQCALQLTLENSMIWKYGFLRVLLCTLAKPSDNHIAFGGFVRNKRSISRW